MGEDLDIWKEQLSRLCSPKQSAYFDDEHFVRVSRQFHLNNEGGDGDDTFPGTPLSKPELESALKALNGGHVPSCDDINVEQVVYVVFLYCSLSVMLSSTQSEFISVVGPGYSYRCLYKRLGHLCPGHYNYRGIPLLSLFEKYSKF